MTVMTGLISVKIDLFTFVTSAWLDAVTTGLITVMTGLFAVMTTLFSNTTVTIGYKKKNWLCYHTKLVIRT